MPRGFNAKLRNHPVLALRAFADANGVVIPERASYADLRLALDQAEVKVPATWDNVNLQADEDALEALQLFEQEDKGTLVGLLHAHGLSGNASSSKQDLACTLVNANVWPNRGDVEDLEAVHQQRQQQAVALAPPPPLAGRQQPQQRSVQQPDARQQRQQQPVQQHQPVAARPPPRESQGLPANNDPLRQPSTNYGDQYFCRPSQSASQQQLQPQYALVRNATFSVIPNHKPWESLNNSVKQGIVSDPFFFFPLSFVRVQSGQPAYAPAFDGDSSGLMDLVNVAQARSYRFRSVWDVYQAFLSGAYHVARLHTKRTADLFAYSAIMFEHCMLNPPVQALVNWDAQIRNASSLNKQPFMANVAAAETRFGHALVSLTSKRPALGPPSASSSSAKRGRARRKGKCLAYNAKRPCDRACGRTHACMWCGETHPRVDCPRAPSNIPQSLAEFMDRNKK